ncbi:PQQ-binding-like beta-propeller repeat protein [Leptolinea tardivitalis]|nr:PQQ-binding-like beta-propeller repeat protein [Leptolinea tardivitalis]GAP20043.1 protein containing FOG: WD40-like repeat [Leptolinea tardivitalis]
MHKRRISLLLLFVTFSFLLSACGGTPAPASWPESLVVDKATLQKLTTDQAIADKQVDTLFVSSGSFVYAINAETGQEIGRYPEKAEGTNMYASAPALLNGSLYVGDYSSQFHSIDPTTRLQKWVKKDATGRFIASPVMIDDLILAPNADGHLYAYNSNGEVRWKFAASNGIWSTPVTDGKTVFISSMDRKLYAIDPGAEGKVLWTVDLGGSVVFSQVLGKDGNLYIGTLNNEIFSIASDSGKINWQVKTSGGVWSPVVVDNDKIFAGDQSGKVFALSSKDGSKIWETDAGSPVVGGLALTDKGLFVGTQNGDALCISVNGQKVWTQTVGGKLYATPVVSGNNVIFGVFEGDKSLAALDENGKLVWTFTPSK